MNAPKQVSWLRLHRLSASFSGMLPMDDFHLAPGLCRYSGGTAPDLHRIPYYPDRSRRNGRHLRHDSVHLAL